MTRNALTRMTLSRHARLCLEPLETRLTPAAMTYLEDFSSDTMLLQPGFDQFDNDVTTAEPDAFLVWNELTRGSEGPSNGPFSDNGYYAIEQNQGAPSQPDTLGFYHLSDIRPAAFSFFFNLVDTPGGLPPGQSCAGVSFQVSGTGDIYVFGQNGSVAVEFAYGNTYKPQSFSSRTLTSSGVPLGALLSVEFVTMSNLHIDDVSVTIDELVQAVGEGDVQVHTLGPDLGIIGDAKSNAIEVTMLDTTTGEVRVTGLGGTTVNGLPEVIVTGVFRDTYITLDKGGDFVSVVGINSDSPLTLEDDLLIDMGGGSNTVVLSLVDVGDLLAIHTRSGVDQVQMTYMETDRLDIRTGTGNDSVHLPSSCQVYGDQLGFHETHGIRTGGGDDVVTLKASLIAGPLLVDLGDGVDGLTFGSHCTGAVTIDLGGNPDQLTMTSGASCHGGLEVLMGGGKDDLFLSDAYFLQAHFAPGAGGALLHVPAKFSCADRNGDQAFLTITTREDFAKLTTIGAHVDIDRLELQA